MQLKESALRTLTDGGVIYIFSIRYKLFHLRVQNTTYVSITPAILHDDVIKWKDFLRYWAFVRGIRRSPVNFPHKRPVTQSVDAYFDLCLNKRLSEQ